MGVYISMSPNENAIKLPAIQRKRSSLTSKSEKSNELKAKVNSHLTNLLNKSLAEHYNDNIHQYISEKRKSGWNVKSLTGKSICGRTLKKAQEKSISVERDCSGLQRMPNRMSVAPMHTIM